MRYVSYSDSAFHYLLETGKCHLERIELVIMLATNQVEPTFVPGMYFLGFSR